MIFLRVVGRKDANMFNSSQEQGVFLFSLLKVVVSLLLPISSFLLSAYSLWRSGRWRKEEKRRQLEGYLFKYLTTLTKDKEQSQEEFLTSLIEKWQDKTYSDFLVVCGARYLFSFLEKTIRESSSFYEIDRQEKITLDQEMTNREYVIQQLKVYDFETGSPYEKEQQYLLQLLTDKKWISGIRLWVLLNQLMSAPVIKAQWSVNPYQFALHPKWQGSNHYHGFYSKFLLKQVAGSWVRPNILLPLLTYHQSTAPKLRLTLEDVRVVYQHLLTQGDHTYYQELRKWQHFLQERTHRFSERQHFWQWFRYYVCPGMYVYIYLTSVYRPELAASLFQTRKEGTMFFNWQWDSFKEQVSLPNLPDQLQGFLLAETCFLIHLFPVTKKQLKHQVDEELFNQSFYHQQLQFSFYSGKE